MADVAKECGLGAVDFSQSFSALPFLFIRARVSNGRRYLAADEFAEAPVIVVEAQA